MRVIATAGHVDHGKSALVRALTGMEPDRWAEERRRGLTIDLGFAWLTLPDGERLAFVDVPGHERFVPNMLSGVGPVPAVLFVVAADGGWMPQSAEHLAAIDALGISRGILAVSRADLADPGPVTAAASAEIGRTSLGKVPAVPVSAVTGEGLAELRAALGELAGQLPAPDPGAPVRLWVDRVFSMTGSGTVVTGTLAAGTIAAGDELLVTPSMRPARIRGIESLRERVSQVSGTARVALNLRGTSAGQLGRGMALVRPGEWTLSATLDVRLAGGEGGWAGRRPPPRLAAHVGSARTAARVRLLGGPFARVDLDSPLPLHVGDRLLLRDPGASREPPRPRPGAGAAWPAIAGATVLDVSPPALARRGAARSAASQLAAWPDPPGPADLLRRHGLLRPAALAAMGLPAGAGLVRAAGWVADPGRWAALRQQLSEAVTAHAAADPLAAGMPLEAARAALGLPDRELVAVLAGEPLPIRDGYVLPAAGRPGAGGGQQRRSGSGGPELPPAVAAAVASLRHELAGSPFAAPEAGRLKELGLGGRELAAAERAGLLLRISREIVLAPGADARAAAILAGLPQPFTTAQARQALGTTRRVAIPLLEYLDRAAVTRRLPDDRRELRAD